MQKLIDTNIPSTLTNPPMANTLVSKKLHHLMGFDLFVKTTFGDSHRRDCKLDNDVDLQSYVNNPSLATPILSTSLATAHAKFRKTPSLSLGLQPLNQFSHNHVRLIPNLNNISSLNRHLYEPNSFLHAPTHDNNPSAVASSLTIVTYYGKDQVDDELQMKHPSLLGKHM